MLLSPSNPRIKLCLFGFLVAVLPVASHYALREHEVAFALRGSDETVIESIRSDASLADGAMSVTDVRVLTRDCMDLLDGDISLNFDEVARADFTRGCLAAMDMILRRNPASARAVVAKLRLMTPLDAGLYDRAATLAPAEPWPLSQRLWSLSRPGLTDAAANMPQSAADDVARAFESEWGQDALANLYFVNEGLRAFILHVAEGRPADEQSKFLARVQKLSVGGA